MTTKDIGDFGEISVIEHIKRLGFEILDKNFHTRYGEIDIIARDKECVVFIEVKARKNSFFGNASEYVDIKKQEKIIKSALCYLDDAENTEFRFDVAEVYYEVGKSKNIVKNINYIENAFSGEEF